MAQVNGSISDSPVFSPKEEEASLKREEAPLKEGRGPTRRGHTVRRSLTLRGPTGLRTCFETIGIVYSTNESKKYLNE